MPCTASTSHACSTPIVPFAFANMPSMSLASVPRSTRCTKSLHRSRASTLSSGGSSGAVGLACTHSHCASSSAMRASSTESCVPPFARISEESSRLHRSARPGVLRGRFLYENSIAVSITGA